MRWKICVVGKPSLAYARAGVDEYLKRLRRYTPVDLHVSKEKGAEENSAQLLKASDGSFRIALDERGELLSTRDWVSKIDDWEMRGSKSISFLLGGAGGHTRNLRNSCDAIWSLSPLTLQHELALVVLLESMYRCYTIKNGEPYHR